MKHKIAIILHFVFCILLILSIYFANERIIFLDNALHIIHCINNNEVGIMAGRWPIAIVRLPLWISIQLHLPLLTLIMVYSISHIVFKLSLIYLAFTFKSYKPILLSLITLFLIINHTFFWNVSELLPALLFVALLYGMLIIKRAYNYYTLALVALILVLAFFSHPLSILAIGFMCLYLFISNKSYSNFIPLCFIGILYAFKKYGFPNWYDQMKMEGLKHNFTNYGFDIQSMPSFSQLISWSYSEFILITIGILISIIVLLYQKKILKAILFTSSTLITMLLIVYSNPEEVPIYYMESSMYLISFYIGIVAVEDIMDKLNHKVIIILFCLLILSSLIRLLSSSHIYTKRVEYITKIVSTVENPKTALIGKNIDSNILRQDWGLPFESLILSEITKPKQQKTIVTIDERRDYQKYLDQKDVLLNGIGGAYEIKGLKTYFSLPDRLYTIDSTLVINNQ